MELLASGAASSFLRISLRRKTGGALFWKGAAAANRRNRFALLANFPLPPYGLSVSPRLACRHRFRRCARRLALKQDAHG